MLIHKRAPLMLIKLNFRASSEFDLFVISACFQPRKVSLGLCLPAECGAVQDVKQLMATMLQQTAPLQGAPREIKIIAIKTLPGEYTFFGDTGFVLLL